MTSDGPLVGVLHGPNLNLLGERETGHYGDATLTEVDAMIARRARDAGADVVTFQSNAEGDLVSWVQDRSSDVAGWLVNAGGLTHTSVALRDALVASGRPFVEVHLSHVFAREPFRRESVLADAAVGLVSGFRARSYLLGLEGLLSHLSVGT